MRKMFFLLLFCLVFSSVIPVLSQDLSHSSEKINLFTSEIVINQDTSIAIKETIDYETTMQKHGIYRYIPTRYNRNSLAYTAKIKDIAVSEANDNKIPFETTFENGNINLKIGDPNTTFTGKKKFILSYRVENTLGRFEKYDELYWDITGEGWKIPILHTVAVVTSPYATINAATCYSGIIGDTDGFCAPGYNEKRASFTYDKTIDYGKNMTVAIALDKNGSIVFPTEFQKKLKTLQDNLLLLLISFPLLVMFLLWFFKGRDFVFVSPNVFNNDENQPKKLRPLFYSLRTPLVYEPIKDITPGEAGTILDEKTENQDIVAEIIDMARKRYFSIKQIEKKGFLGMGGNKDYLFKKLKNMNDKNFDLPSHQQYLFNSFFSTRDEVLLSDLKGSFYLKMKTTADMIYQSITKEKLFTRNPMKTRSFYLGVAIVLNIIGWFLVVSVIGYLSIVTIPILIFALQSLLSVYIALRMPQKTAKGTNLMLQVRGLKQTIKRGAWREKIKEKHLFIEEILPFAISLGVVGKLVKDMEGLNVSPPEYFQSLGMNNVAFGSFVNSFTNQVSSNLSYNPSSSKWSSGSGFSGGSSGGGGGGGGGGSW